MFDSNGAGLGEFGQKSYSGVGVVDVIVGEFLALQLLSVDE
jgi:hypothetical protein